MFYLVDGQWVGEEPFGELGSVVVGLVEGMSVGQWLVVDGLVVNLSVGWWSVVGGSVENLSVNWWSIVSCW